MSDAPTLIYLEIDDEITSVVRRVRAADPGRVVIVAPGRSRATSSSVALRLLARAAEGDGRQIAIVGDALTRSLAAEAGLAAYGGVADARRADPAERAEPGESHTAAIHIVRGEAADDTAPTLMAAAATSDAETRSVPVAHPASVAARPRPSTRRPARRRISVAAGLAGLAAVLVAWGAVGAAVLPAATIAITPRSEAIGPEPDVIRMADADSISDTISDTATVTASGSYDIRAAATGSATFFNFNFFDVVVPAESLVATGREEGDQAYLTVEAVTVPAGVFDPFFGGITAGEASAPITAAAIGSDGNVEAGVIDTVLDPDLEGQLRGFPTITEPLVTNPEPTSGGDERSGVEITQEDVDAAVAELREALEQAAAEALAPSESLLFADPAEPPGPQIEEADGLVGTRDTETAEISGSLSYDRLTADPADVDERAANRFRANAELVPEGWALVDSQTTVEIGTVRRDGDELVVDVTVTGLATPVIERGTVLQRVIGRSADDGEAALADLGASSIDLWPFWVGTVPDSDWRIELVVAGEGEEADEAEPSS